MGKVVGLIVKKPADGKQGKEGKQSKPADGKQEENSKE